MKTSRACGAGVGGKCRSLVDRRLRRFCN
jgi:hypothetical protein